MYVTLMSLIDIASVCQPCGTLGSYTEPLWNTKERDFTNLALPVTNFSVMPACLH